MWIAISILENQFGWYINFYCYTRNQSKTQWLKMTCYSSQFCKSGIQAGLNCSMRYDLGLLTVLHSVNKAHLDDIRRLHSQVWCLSASLPVISRWLAQASSQHDGVKVFRFLTWTVAFPKRKQKLLCSLKGRLKTSTASLSPA